jgi:pimeloyl-ACP methyl ester carboxylesterase
LLLYAGKVPGMGWSFGDLIEFLHLTISDITKGDDFVLVTHDWGAFLGLLYQTKYPDKIKKLVLLDVGMLDVFTVSLTSMIYITMYQVWNALSFIVSRIFGVTIGTIFMGLFYLPIFKPLWPTRNEIPPVPRKEIRADKCYPYFHLWKQLLTTLKVPKVDFPRMPTLYLVRNVDF